MSQNRLKDFSDMEKTLIYLQKIEKYYQDINRLSSGASIPSPHVPPFSPKKVSKTKTLLTYD